jgi:hypothetical protein
MLSRHWHKNGKWSPGKRGSTTLSISSTNLACSENQRRITIQQENAVPCRPCREALDWVMDAFGATTTDIRAGALREIKHRQLKLRNPVVLQHLEKSRQSEEDRSGRTSNLSDDEQTLR